MEKQIKIKKIIWTTLLIIAILPFLLTLIVGVDASINGTSDGLCIMCDRIYGMEAFEQILIFAIYLFWPAYLIALIVIILAIIRLVMLRRKTKDKQV